MNTESVVVRLPDGVSLSAFAPVAYFDKHMDCIRVVTMDRSVTEHRVDGFLTLHKSNHRLDLDPEYVGFTIKGIRHLFESVGLDLNGVHRLADIIDRLVKHRPGSAMSTMLELVYREFKENGDLEVNLAA
ncbi:conserved hypothetical protein [Mesorhizobium sp. SOD10]|nr:conserved hypothetical protein [Mesorhizobium sp. SOD10]